MSARPADGKRIKCPSCAETFVPELDEDDEAAGNQEKPSAKAKPAPKTSSSANAKKPNRVEDDEDEDDEDDDAPKKKAKRTDDDEDEDAPKKKSKRQDDDEDEEEDEDERPAKKSKKAKKKAGSMMPMLLMLLAGGGVFLGLGACGIGAFVWPGFFVDGDKKNVPIVIAKDLNAHGDDKKTDDAKNAPVIEGTFVPGDGKMVPGKGKLLGTFTSKNMIPDQIHERVFQFQKGKRITATSLSTSSGPINNVALYVLQGTTGEPVPTALDESGRPDRLVSFTVLAPGPYRVSAVNHGPDGTTTSCVVHVYEQ